MYNLLIVGQGYNNAEVDKFWADYNTVYTYLQNTDPFSSALKRWSFSYNEYGIYADPGIGVSWGISSSPLMPDVLTLPSDIEKRISAYLESRGIQTTNDLDNLIPATSLWNANRFGDTGCLIVILVKSQQKGEFYDLIPRVDRPYPIVAVTTVGQLWVQLVGRALAQSRALLGDEFEMEGPAFDKPPSDYLYLPGSIPNLLMIDDAMRAKMRANCTDVYDLLPPDWRPFPVLAPFFPNENRKANEEPRDCNGNRADTGWFKAVEGGFGYRHNVIRADVDCLMRRIPASYKLYNPAPPNADLLPVQADVDFCSACKGVLHNRLHRDTFGLDELRPRTLETQRSQIAVSWRERHEIQPFPSLPFSVTKEDPSPHLLKWQYTSEVNAIDGLVIRDVKLLNRNDFFKKAENVLKSVRFTDLGVRFTDGSAQSLKFADGISNTQFPPQLVFYSHGGEGDMLRVGVKLMASWVVSGYRVEATASLVLRDQARDIEPGAFLDACRLYPQLTMKYEAIASTNLRVKELYGTIEIVANNVIPESLRGTLGEYIGEIQYGQLAVEFVTDSNTSDDDADVLKPPPGGIVNPLELYVIPAIEFIPGGRKLAGIDRTATPIPGFPVPVAIGQIARQLYRYDKVPPLTYWSWFFDYAMPLTESQKSFTGVYRKGDKTPLQSDGGTTRLKSQFPWPPKKFLKDQNTLQPQLSVKKLPRQGDFDNVHIMPDIGVLVACND